MKVSIIVASRNDDHGGNLVWRTQAFIDMLYAQMQYFHVEAELILVEWNPVEDAPLLHDLLKWPRTGAYWSGKAFVVPDYVHAQITDDTGIDFFQWWAKNVGIRRARHEWILCTNPDVVFSDALMQQVVDISERRIYGTHRNDLSVPTIPSTLPRERVLTFCQENVMRVNTASVFDILTDGCGDFMLATKRDWWQLRGYPETKTWSIHLDSLALLQMICIYGLQQQVLDGGVYHIEHGGSWTYDQHWGKQYPQYDMPAIMKLITAMHDERVPAYKNLVTWGLAEVVEMEAIIK